MLSIQNWIFVIGILVSYAPQVNAVCGDQEHECSDGECITVGYLCDLVPDCEDGGDEDIDFCLTHPCLPRQFDCVSNRNKTIAREKMVCIPSSWVCDREEDCAGGEDEEGCDVPPPPTCRYNYFTCNDGACIPHHFECDRIMDCEDGSDEHSGCEYRNCTQEEFQCDNLNCIHQNRTCNGRWDCRDESDETEALCYEAPAECPQNEFRCNNNMCISEHLLCNQNDDCRDNSDETNCGVDECAASPSPCSDVCHDNPTSFTCSCPDHFKLADDKHNCVDINECDENPTVCSQGCSNGPGNYSCSCGPGYTLTPAAFPQRSTCTKTDTTTAPYILFANSLYTRSMNLTGGNYTIQSHSHNHIHVLDYDLRRGKYYIVDALSKQVITVDMDHSNVTAFRYENQGDIEGLAYDWVNNLFYFTNSEAGQRGVHVGTMDGKVRKVLVDGGYTVLPRAIVVDPANGYLFWTDWALHTFIGRAGMDGSDIQEIVKNNMFWPNALTIDCYSDRIWWGDAYFDTIEFAYFDGTGRTQLMAGSPHIYAMTLFEDTIYWTEWNLKRIYSADKYTGQNKTLVKETIHQPYDIHVVDITRQPMRGVNPCGVNNGGCSHLCLIAPPGNKRTCACPGNLILDHDQQTCIANCSAAEFECKQEKKCIAKLWYCDGRADCEGDEDEPTGQCPSRQCASRMFECGDDSCAYEFEICDGWSDCNNGMDENATMCANRQCLPEEFKCGNGKCIPGHWHCDGDDDCSAGDDEIGCANRTMPECKPNQFQCTNGKCINKMWYCDWDDDCGDGSDEPQQECHGRPCPDGWTHCTTNYRCVPVIKLCDGKNDCRDNSDEDPTRCPTCDPTGDFTCANGDCIPLRWKCDFQPDCNDNSDEDPAICTNQHRNCSEIEFQCANMKCIRKTYRCDQDDDCGDGSDEQNCEQHTCPANRFQCASGHCIPERYRCDHDRDCVDASDESGCPTEASGRKCPDDQFQCDNYVCVPQIWACDGEDDCGDESDEAPESCTNNECTWPLDFRCNNARCLPTWFACDGEEDCGDGTDENLETCPHFSHCDINTEFECSSTRECVHNDQVCDFINDCADLSDELGCHKAHQGNCSHFNGNCSEICNPLQGQGREGYYCSCNRGYIIDSTDPRECQDIDECMVWGHNCTQKCLNTNGDYACECDSTWVDESNSTRGVNCVPKQGAKPLLLIGDSTTIRSYALGTQVYTDAAILESSVQAITVNVEAQTMYWVDSDTATVKGAEIPLGDVIAIGNTIDVGVLRHPESIAYDFLGRNLFISDSHLMEIFVTKEQGGFKRTIVNSTNTQPSAIAVNPYKGLLYYINVHRIVGPRIESVWLDGTNRKFLVSSMLQDPTSLAVDYWSHDHRVYFCDRKANLIEVMKFDGSDRKTVFQTSPTHVGLDHRPVDIDVFGTQIYWTNMDSGEVRKRSKFGHEDEEIVVTALEYDHRGLSLYQEQKYLMPASHGCSNTQCSHFCVILPQPQGAKCLCPNGHSFMAQSTTACQANIPVGTTPKSQSCLCQNGGQCIATNSGTLVCNCINGYYGLTCENEPRTPPTPGTPRTRPTKPTKPPTTPRSGFTTTTTVSSTTTQFVNQSVPKPHESGMQQATAIAIAVPVALIAIILIIIIVVLVMMFRSGRIKSGHGEFRQGPNRPGMATDIPPMDAVAVEYNVGAENVKTGFTNPIYDAIPAQGGMQGAEAAIQQNTSFVPDPKAPDPDEPQSFSYVTLHNADEKFTNA